MQVPVPAELPERLMEGKQRTTVLLRLIFRPPLDVPGAHPLGGRSERIEKKDGSGETAGRQGN